MPDLQWTTWIGPGLAIWGGVAAPFVAWSIRTHFRIVAAEKRLDDLDAARQQSHDDVARLERILQDVRLDLARLGALQGAMNESIRRIEDRLEV